MKKAIFAGSFDPFTLGHKDIVVRASKLFDQVIVAIAEDNGKRSMPLESRKQIASLSLEGIKNVSVATFEGLLTDFMEKSDCSILVRGVRTSVDFEYEKTLMGVYRTLKGDLEFVLLPANPEFAHISSTTVRELAKLGNLPSGYVDTKAEEAVRELYGAQK